MKHSVRLTRSTDFQRVRRNGKSYAHPFLILNFDKNELGITRIGIAAGLRLGGAVERNRAKRRLRPILAYWLPMVKKGHDVVIIARTPLKTASFMELMNAVGETLKRAGLIE